MNSHLHFEVSRIVSFRLAREPCVAHLRLPPLSLGLLQATGLVPKANAWSPPRLCGNDFDAGRFKSALNLPRGLCGTPDIWGGLDPPVGCNMHSRFSS